MRIRVWGCVKEVEEVLDADDGIHIGCDFYCTGDDTERIITQLLKEGYADLRSFECVCVDVSE